MQLISPKWPLEAGVKICGASVQLLRNARSVPALSRKTSDAAEDISRRIADICRATEDSVGVIGSNYVLQATTNFTTWTPISTNTAITNQFNLFDLKATNFPFRFYRVLQQ